MKNRHVNIPVFIPHRGCGHACVFCDQKSITGIGREDFSGVEAEIERALSTVTSDPEDIQIAFFGGSFTGIDRGDMLYLLGVAGKFISAGRAGSIRLSTRPDYIDGEILRILAEYGVRTIELGIQSTSDRVLAAARRGHIAETALRAMDMIKSAGFELVGQMMTMLPGAEGEDEIKTAEDIIKAGCIAARIYPLVIFRGTEMAELVRRGEYAVPSPEETLDRTTDVLSVFIKSGIPVIRLGLQSNEGLVTGTSVYAGQYDESIGEKCYSEYFLRSFISRLGEEKRGGELYIYVSPRNMSKAAGCKRRNAERLTEKYGFSRVSIKPDPEIDGYGYRIENRRECGNAFKDT